MTCRFCNIPKDEILMASKKVMIIKDNYPVTENHLLIIPRRHVSSWFDAYVAEAEELIRAIDYAKGLCGKDVDGYNIGINVGEAAGQTIDHLHIHLIPRRFGDMDDPRGGVRGVIPEKQKY